MSTFRPPLKNGKVPSPHIRCSLPNHTYETF